MTTGSPAEPMDMAESGMHRIVRIAVRPGMARAIIIDDFHHFRIGLRHDGQAVTALCSRAARTTERNLLPGVHVVQPPGLRVEAGALLRRLRHLRGDAQRGDLVLGRLDIGAGLIQRVLPLERE